MELQRKIRWIWFRLVLFSVVFVLLGCVVVFDWENVWLPGLTASGGQKGAFTKNDHGNIQQYHGSKETSSETVWENVSKMLENDVTKEDKIILDGRVKTFSSGENEKRMTYKYLDDPVTVKKTYEKTSVKDSRQRQIKIALYNIRHTMLRNQASSVKFSKCYYFRNCELVTVDKKSHQPIESDAVVFQGNSVPGILPARLSRDQAFIYVNIESPQYLNHTDLSDSRFRDFYNWTMTYRRDSDISYWYGRVVPRHCNDVNVLHQQMEKGNFIDFKNFTIDHDNSSTLPPTPTKKNYSAIFKQKTRVAIWLVSHCGAASRRDQYVQRMQPHVDVDIFGQCSNQSNKCPKNDKGCGNDIENTYKFFIAFENSLCKDYITEKVFSWYMRDIVVVRGAIYYKGYLPQGTYIDSNDFQTPESLAYYLTELALDEKRYISFLQKKDDYRTISATEHVQLAYCGLCYRLNNLEIYRKPATSLHDWWISGKCTVARDLK